MSTRKTEKASQWQKTPVSNLVRYAPSGIHYARLRVSGKLIWKFLKTGHKWLDLGSRARRKGRRSGGD